MNLLNKLTIKNLKLNKKRTIVTIIGIMLSVALITAVASIYASGIKSLIKFETREKGNFHTVFYDVPMTDIDVFENNRNIETLNITKSIGYAKIDSKNEYKPYAYIKAFTKDSLNNLSVKLVKGKLPENENEIVIPTHLQTNGRLFLNIGDSITLDIGKRIDDSNYELNQNNPYQKTDEENGESIVETISKTYKIVGIIERPATNVEGYSAPGYTFITYIDENKLTGNVDVYARFTKDGVKNSYESITIPRSVKSIGEGVFYNCRNLTSITISNSVESIGKNAFYQCSNLKSITIPNSITSIGEGVFSNCSNLTSITIPNSVTSIEQYAFYNCSNLISITIPNSVTSIGKNAFRECTSLTSITISNSVESIGEYAFYQCSNLTSVYYKGNSSQWSSISIDSNNTPLTNATIYYYSETEPTESGKYWHYVDEVPTIWVQE